MGFTASCVGNTNIECLGGTSYCAIGANTNTIECMGYDSYCAANLPNAAYCGGSQAYCEIQANQNEDICRQGTDAFCASGYNSNHGSCPGTDAYCQDQAHALEPICTVGDPVFCELPRHKDIHPACIAGSDVFCNLPQHKNIHPTCIPGNPAFCALPQHKDTHPECPGTVSYCTKYPYDDLCGTNYIPPPCVAAGNCTTPYQVNVTSKSTTVGHFLCQLIYETRSNVGRLVAVLGVIFIALGAMFGQVRWPIALAAVTGIAAILGASELVVLVGNNITALSNVLACLTQV
jgi:type IV secretory pathway VirB2 component (pilin)